MEKQIQLGFCEVMDELWDVYPSKVGGKPVWLVHDNIPTAESVTCARCGKVMSFLLQIYAPLLNSPFTYHRTIYVFCCRKFECIKYCPKGSFKVFRAQLPKVNKYYNTSETEIYVNENRLCRVSGLYGNFKCGGCQSVYYGNKQFQQEDWQLGHREECKLLKQAKSQSDIDKVTALLQKMDISLQNKKYKNLFLEYVITTEAAKTPTQSNPTDDTPLVDNVESDEDIEEQVREQNRKIIEHYNKVTQGYDNVEFQDNDWVFSESQKDVFFQNFMRVISEDQEQILRYYEDRQIEPLWVSSLNRPIPVEQYIKKCECGADRIIEFQIMPQLLYMLKVEDDEDPLDWGTLAVYTCKNSCQRKDYIEEVLWPQQISPKQ